MRPRPTLIVVEGKTTEVVKTAAMGTKIQVAMWVKIPMGTVVMQKPAEM
jgi:hypothetical protein